MPHPDQTIGPQRGLHPPSPFSPHNNPNKAG